MDPREDGYLKRKGAFSGENLGEDQDLEKGIIAEDILKKENFFIKKERESFCEKESGINAKKENGLHFK